MPNIIIGYKTDESLTVKAYYDNSGTMTLRGSQANFTEEPVASGSYIASYASVQNGDLLVIHDSVKNVLWGYYDDTSVGDLNNLSSANITTACDTAITENTDIGNISADVTLIKVETDLLDGMIIEDSAGNQFTVAALQNAPTAEMDATELANAMKTITGLTVGGTWTWEKIMKITTAFIGGDWRLSADGTKQELLDAEDGATIILEQDLTRSPSAGDKYRNLTVKI